MLNKSYIAIVVLLLLLGGYYLWEPRVNVVVDTNTTVTTGAFDLLNQSFSLDGQVVTFVNGASADGTVKFFGNEVQGDLTFDGQADVAYLVTYEPGGSGIFFYAVVAVKTSGGYKTTNAFLVGDRIAPQNNLITSGELHINFAERLKGEPFTTRPSQGAVLLLKVTPDGVLEGLMK